MSVAAHPPHVADPPRPRRAATLVERHGEQWIDEYAWMSGPYGAEMRAHLLAENAYARSVMAPQEQLADRLYQEFVNCTDEHDIKTTRQTAQYHYYCRIDRGLELPLECRRAHGPDAVEEVLLDLNALARGAFARLGVLQVSDDERYLAYALDLTGCHRFTLFIKDLVDGRSQEVAAHVRTAAWDAGGRSLYYTAETTDERALYRYVCATGAHERLYRESDPAFRLRVSRTGSGGYLLLRSGSLTAVEYRFQAADQLDGEWRLIAPRRAGLHYEVAHHGSAFYIRTNDRGSNMRLVEADVSRPDPSAWKEIVACRPDVALTEVAVFKNYLVLFESVAGTPRIRARHFESTAFDELELPDPVRSIRTLGSSGEFLENRLRFRYESPTVPPSTVEYDLERRTQESSGAGRMGARAAGKYQSQRLSVTAPDGVQIPMTLVYARGFVRDATAPGSLYAYGAYGNSASVTLSPAKMSLLDRGVVIAVAHVRGGGELGKAWHDAGRVQNKHHSFTDLLACAQYLTEQRWVGPGRIIVQGASAGGMLATAVANRRPDLFRAVVVSYPFVDVLNTMLDASQPLTLREFDEWGNPEDPDAFRRIRSYCPYSNISAQPYPAVLVRNALYDRQVMYWEAAKYVARLRQLNTGTEPVLLLTNMAAGHGGPAGQHEVLRETAAECAFMLWQWGVA